MARAGPAQFIIGTLFLIVKFTLGRGACGIRGLAGMGSAREHWTIQDLEGPSISTYRPKVVTLEDDSAWNPGS